MSLSAPYQELAAYRRVVAEMYARARAAADPAAGWAHLCEERVTLFATHPQSALSAEQKAAFTGLRYFPYEPALRFTLPVEAEPDARVLEVDLPEDGRLAMQRFGRVHFAVAGQPVSLALYWIRGYGGGIFLPFRDATNGHETYGGGRYLLDTIKGADLGSEGDRLVLDFNFAYNPSCAYNPAWHCPLAPAENRLPAPIRAGEQVYG